MLHNISRNLHLKLKCCLHFHFSFLNLYISNKLYMCGLGFTNVVIFLTFYSSPANIWFCSCSSFASVMDGVKEVRVEAAPYCCSTCDGEEVTCRNLAQRSRKTRSLSTSSASTSSEYRSVSLKSTVFRTKNQESRPVLDYRDIQKPVGLTHS